MDECPEQDTTWCGCASPIVTGKPLIHAFEVERNMLQNGSSETRELGRKLSEPRGRVVDRIETRLKRLQCF